MSTVSEARHAPRAAAPGALPKPDAITMAAFAGVVLLAGANPVAVRFSNAELAPLWGAAVRFSIAAAILFAIAAVRRIPLPRGRQLAGAAIFGLLSTFGAYSLVYIALQHVPASVAAPIMASVPLLTFFLAVGHRVERFRWRGLIGGITSVAGIAVLSGIGSSSGAPIKYLLFTLGAAICAAESGIVIKKFPPVHPIMMNAVAMGIGSVLLYAASFIGGEAHVVPELAKTWLAFAYLVIGGSTIMFMLYVAVVRRWTVTGASYQFVMFPIVSVLIASWLADEAITASIISGAALVIAGVYIGALSGHRHRAAGTKPATGVETPPPC